MTSYAIKTKSGVRCGDKDFPAGSRLGVITVEPGVPVNYLVDGMRNGKLTEELDESLSVEGLEVEQVDEAAQPSATKATKPKKGDAANSGKS
ncbi:MAG: hypothetical protein ACPGXK_00190 [Phycisphaerae bacterium]